MAIPIHRATCILVLVDFTNCSVMNTPGVPAFRSAFAWARVCLLVQNDAQEGVVDVQPAVILDEAQFPEFVHEKIDPRPRCTDHLGQHLLRLALRPIARQQQ